MLKPGLGKERHESRRTRDLQEPHSNRHGPSSSLSNYSTHSCARTTHRQLGHKHIWMMASTLEKLNILCSHATALYAILPPLMAVVVVLLLLLLQPLPLLVLLPFATSASVIFIGFPFCKRRLRARAYGRRLTLPGWLFTRLQWWGMCSKYLHISRIRIILNLCVNVSHLHDCKKEWALLFLHARCFLKLFSGSFKSSNTSVWPTYVSKHIDGKRTQTWLWRCYRETPTSTEMTPKNDQRLLGLHVVRLVIWHLGLDKHERKRKIALALTLYPNNRRQWASRSPIFCFGNKQLQRLDNLIQ